ncbi:MAG: MFS transporter [Alphaproteobacteria bacterium]|nr:MFS transporter [Alphaproteobacteria bacterium]
MISIKNAPNYLILARTLQWAIFPLPVIMLLYQYKGASIGDFFLIQGIFAIFTFMLEIPSGYMGDLFSRKNVISLGFFSFMMGNVMWLFIPGLSGIVCGEAMFAVSHSLCSGTIEAYLYDLLKKEHKEYKMNKKLGKMETYSGISMMLATLTGGFLYEHIGPTAVIWGSLWATFLALLISFFLPDIPEIRRHVTSNSKIKDVLNISQTAFKNNEIKWLIIYPSLFGLGTLILMWGLQPIMIAKEIPVYVFGFVGAFNMMCRVGWSSSSAKLCNLLGINGLIKLLLFVVIIGFGAAVSVGYPTPLPLTFLLLGMMAIAAGSHIMVKIVTTTLINHRIQSDERATVLSLKSMADKLFSGIGLILLKPLFDIIGIQQTFLVSSSLILMTAVVSYHLIKMQIEPQPTNRT